MGKGKKKAIKTSVISYGVCHCGCEGIPTGKKALFITGHDGKLRSILVRFQEGKETSIPNIAKEILPTFYKGKYKNVA